jgi:signal transduction histidine kinase
LELLVCGLGGKSGPARAWPRPGTWRRAAAGPGRGDRGGTCRRTPRSSDVRPARLRITRLLANLLDNAERHATSQITVTLRADTVRADGSTATLEVIDDGAGIAPEHREKVFDRFTRLDASRNRDAGGTGLGLPIARQIAQAHQGTLTIQDSTRGARFVLRLPRCDRGV